MTISALIMLSGFNQHKPLAVRVLQAGCASEVSKRVIKLPMDNIDRNGP